MLTNRYHIFLKYILLFHIPIELISDNLNFVALYAIGYLSCCRFLDDSQIVTSSGDTTW